MMKRSVNDTSQSSISKDDIRYHIIDFDNQSFLASKFQWLDKWMLYLPLFVSILPSKRQRSKGCRLVIILLLIVTIIWTMLSFYYFMPQIHEFSHNIILLLGTFCQVAIFVVVRFFSLIYFYFYFNYPWHIKLRSFSGNTDELFTNNNKNCIKMVKYYKSILQISIVLIFTSWIALSIGISLFYNINPNQLVLAVVGSFLTSIPNSFTIIIQCTICFKFYWYLSQIMNNIRSNMAVKDINHLLLQYKEMYEVFKKDYSFVVKWTVNLYIISWLINEFVGIQDPIYTYTNSFSYRKRAGLFLMGYGALVNITIQLLLYIISSILLSETFQSLQELLWNELNCLIGSDNIECQAMLTSFIVYSTKYSINVSFAGIIMTRRHILLFTIGFVAAKCAAEALSVMYKT